MEADHMPLNVAVNVLAGFQEARFINLFFRWKQRPDQLYPYLIGGGPIWFAQKEMRTQEEYLKDINRAIKHYEDALTRLDAYCQQIMYTNTNVGRALFFDELRKYRKELGKVDRKLLHARINARNEEGRRRYEEAARKEKENPSGASSSLSRCEPDVLNLDYEPEYVGTIRKLKRLFVNICDKHLVRSELASPPRRPSGGKKKQEGMYSQRQLAIAWFLMGKPITTGNAKEILIKYSEARSVAAFLRRRVTSVKELTRSTGNKSADTKHLVDLLQVERFLKNADDQRGCTQIREVITAFERNRLTSDGNF